MATAYSLGAMNDNFFKQAASLMAVAASKSELQGVATIVFTLPYLLFAAPAGWLSDRFAKRSVIIGAKALELVAMLAGAAGIYWCSWPLIFIMLFIMALQSTIFSPALNGSIPELYPESFVTAANGRVRMVVTVSVLLGIALAGRLLDLKGNMNDGTPVGQAAVAGVVIGLALVGLVVSLGVPRIRAAGSEEPFPWSGPAETVRVLWATREDRLLAVSIFANAVFWMMASLQVQLINVLGLDQYCMRKTQTSGMLVTQMVGIGLGGMLAGRLAGGKTWHRVLVPSALGMALPMLALVFVPGVPGSVFQVVLLFLFLGTIGMSGGLFMVPLEAFIQIRPKADEKGRAIASANFAAFAGIALSGPLYYLLNRFCAPTFSFGLIGVLALALALWLRSVLPRAVEEDEAPRLSSLAAPRGPDVSAGGSGPAARAAAWQCPRCSNANAGGDSKCISCGAPRSGESRETHPDVRP
jgi:MFS family permease